MQGLVEVGFEVLSFSLKMKKFEDEVFATTFPFASIVSEVEEVPFCEIEVG